MSIAGWLGWFCVLCILLLYNNVRFKNVGWDLDLFQWYACYLVAPLSSHRNNPRHSLIHQKFNSPCSSRPIKKLNIIGQFSVLEVPRMDSVYFWFSSFIFTYFLAWITSPKVRRLTILENIPISHTNSFRMAQE